ncbi:MAG: hypothetical protein A3K75_05700 [Euryarchaeota archaeon RBG_13_61_15]|nr:MAG: hypothetical protein A3K75_05700 [Euryarchaeota archaeon RBG_13_61_15]
MGNSKRSIAVSLLIALPVLMMAAPVAGAPATDAWTVMVYIDADNNLESFGIMNWHQLESVGSSDKVNFVVLLDTYAGPASLMYVNEGDSKVLGDWGEVNMADPATMSAFIKAAKKAAPAENYAFISWDHGGGWRGMNWDDTSSEETGVSQYTDMAELRKAVVDAGVVFDVFAFDQCLMAQPEVAYQVRGYADYVVFSEETIYGQGFPYDAIAADLVADPGMDAEEFSTTILEDFAYYYDSITWANDWTISAFDMAYMNDVKTAVGDLASSSLAVLGTYKPQFKSALSQTQTYYYPYYADLKGYALNLLADPQIKDAKVKSAANAVVTALDDGVLLSINSKHNSDSHGMSIYFPSYRSSYLGLKAAYENVPFATDSGWLLWLQSFASNK